MLWAISATAESSEVPSAYVGKGPNGGKAGPRTSFLASGGASRADDILKFLKGSTVRSLFLRLFDPYSLAHLHLHA